MRLFAKGRSVRFAVALGLVVGGGTGLIASAAMAGSPAGENQRAPATGKFAVNQYGEAYGSILDSLSPDREPDLVEVIATNGSVGYVRSSELNETLPTTPEEARAYRPGARLLTVYESDGRTAVGIFEIGSAADATVAE